MVVAHANGLQVAMADAQIAVHDQDGRPSVAVVPAVGRNGAMSLRKRPQIQALPWFRPANVQRC